ncbi:MAG: hypothetical protein JOZ74_08830 [Bradyrhizobium sp.]|nr:hypothetical protein [Bradyrhizobium sp.]
MSIETLEVEAAAERPADGAWSLQWTPIVAGAFIACAVSSIMITFATSVGLGVSSTAPTWRDASIALWVLSGLYLILQALISFGCGGYFAGRVRSPYAATVTDDVEKRDGFHGIASWALAVILGTALAALVASSLSRPTSLTQPASPSEPSVLSYELDHLFRSARRPPNLDLAPLRAEAGRILMTSSSHSGVSGDDRAYLVQLVTATTGLSGADADRRVDTVIGESRTAISRTRAATIVLAFSLATALLLGAIAAWAAAEAGGRHRDGMPLSDWMLHANRFHRRRGTWERPSVPRV